MPPTFLTRSSSTSSFSVSSVVSDHEDSCSEGPAEIEEERFCGAYPVKEDGASTSASACHSAPLIIDLKGSDLNRLRQVLQEELSCRRRRPPAPEFHQENDEMVVAATTATTTTPVTNTIQLVMPPLSSSPPSSSSSSTSKVTLDDSSFFFSTNSCIVLGYQCHVVRNHRPHLTTEDFLGGTSLTQLWENMALSVYQISNSC